MGGETLPPVGTVISFEVVGYATFIREGEWFINAAGHLVPWAHKFPLETTEARIILNRRPDAVPATPATPALPPPPSSSLLEFHLRERTVESHASALYALDVTSGFVEIVGQDLPSGTFHGSPLQAVHFAAVFGTRLVTASEADAWLRANGVAEGLNALELWRKAQGRARQQEQECVKAASTFNANEEPGAEPYFKIKPDTPSPSGIRREDDVQVGGVSLRAMLDEILGRLSTLEQELRKRREEGKD